MKTAIVTDSTADIPASLADQLDIFVVPAIVVINGESTEDGRGLTRREFYEQLPQMNPLPTTASPSAGTFGSIYKCLFEEGAEQIISIHVSSQLSGIYNTAALAAQPFQGRVQVVDSQSLSVGIGFQAIAAAEAAARGASRAEITTAIESTRQKLKLVAMLDTLEYVRRSGRVGWARARVGSLLRIKPFLEVKDGQVFNLGQTRTRRKGIAHLLDELHNLGPFQRLAILPVTDDHLAGKPHARADVAELASAVRRLVQIHEIHVDRRPGDFGVELGMQLHQRFVQRLQSRYPHFGR